ncbi:hypothetical protein [Xanthocytophaga agilis]|uniref:Transmembrane protein n=1 Tax=Xanthocytophaga agilis TaxID=3048010 RepID=A0AAE3RA21_9BACT|nr:hypothetical protein [Xanthocytophaga agilis]MDJ1504265.1 hypothetical protein [Xanthocytophaga agilis]
MKYQFTIPTLKFSVAGFFISGFSMTGILGLQTLLQSFTQGCEVAWKLLFILMASGSIITPFIFTCFVLKDSQSQKFSEGKIWLYNLLEYIFLQCSIGWLFSNAKTLCYVSDGQNGLQFVFTSWMGLCIQLFYSLLLDWMKNNKTLTQSVVLEQEL